MTTSRAKIQDGIYFSPAIRVKRKPSGTFESRSERDLNTAKEHTIGDDINKGDFYLPRLLEPNEEPKFSEASRKRIQLSGNLLNTNPLSDLLPWPTGEPISTTETKSKRTSEHQQNCISQISPKHDFGYDSDFPDLNQPTLLETIPTPTENMNNQIPSPKEVSGLYIKVSRTSSHSERWGPGNLGRKVKGLPKLEAEISIRHHAVLDEMGRVHLRHQRFVELQERVDVQLITPLKLYLMRSSDFYQERPMMPCANNTFLLDNFDHKHGYQEPVRNRSRNWWEELWTELAPNLIPFRKRIAQEATEAEALAAFESKRKVYVDGVLMNQLLILRQGAVLSGHAMVLSVYGMGIAGRVYIKPARFPRHLKIEAYCPRQMMTYTLRVDLEDLENLFKDSLYMLDPGHKKELCEELLQMLYLDESIMALRLARKVPQESTLTQQRRKERKQARISQQERLLRISRGEDVDGLHATLRSTTADSTGHKTRKRPWLRLQDQVLSTVVRLSNYKLVLTVHAPARRKNVLIIRAYDQESSKTFQLILSLRELGRRLGDKRDPDLWDTDQRKTNCEAMISMLSLRSLNVAGTEMALAIQDRVGLARPGLGLKKNETRRHALTLPSALLKTIQGGGHDDRGDARRSTILPGLGGGGRMRKSTMVGSRRTTIAMDQATSRKDIGKGKLLCRCIHKISHETCIISFYSGRGDQDLVSWVIYVIKTSETHRLTLSRSELEALLKTHPEIVEEQLNANGYRAQPLSENVLCNIILRERIALGPGWIPVLDRSIYRRGHRLKWSFPNANTNGISQQSVGIPTSPTVSKTEAVATQLVSYCVVTVYLLDATTIEFEVFERASCQTCTYRSPQEVMEAIMTDLKALNDLERTVQLGTIIASFKLSRTVNGLITIHDI